MLRFSLLLAGVAAFTAPRQFSRARPLYIDADCVEADSCSVEELQDLLARDRRGSSDEQTSPSAPPPGLRGAAAAPTARGRRGARDATRRACEIFARGGRSPPKRARAAAAAAPPRGLHPSRDDEVAATPRRRRGAAAKGSRPSRGERTRGDAAPPQRESRPSRGERTRDDAAATRARSRRRPRSPQVEVKAKAAEIKSLEEKLNKLNTDDTAKLKSMLKADECELNGFDGCSAWYYE